MTQAISLGDLESAAVRSLAGFRSHSKAGLAVNATTNTYTVTIANKQTDDIIDVTVSVDGVAETATYTVLVGDVSNDAVATALEVQIEALTGVASSATGAVITVTPATTTKAIVVTATVTKAVGDPTTTATVAQTIIGAKGIKTANTVLFSLDGHAGSKAATNNIALTGSAIPASSYRWWLVTVDTSGNFTATPGTDNKNVLPDIPASQSVVGAFKIATAAATTFTPGTTGLNSTGITDTYYDLSVVPTAGYPA